MPAREMPDRALHAGFRQASAGRNGLQAHRDRIARQLLAVAQQEEIDHEGRGTAIVTDQVRHQHIRHVRVEGDALHISKYYTVK